VFKILYFIKVYIENTNVKYFINDRQLNKTLCWGLLAFFCLCGTFEIFNAHFSVFSCLAFLYLWEGFRLFFIAQSSAPFWTLGSGTTICSIYRRSRSCRAEPVDVLTIHLYANLNRAKGNDNSRPKSSSES